jgi:hypothetical protein
MMEIVFTIFAFIVAALCAGLMGFAIQRGATCTVAAIEELVNKRRLNRLISMVEASLWVVGGLLLAQSLHLLPEMPAAYAVSYLTVGTIFSPPPSKLTGSSPLFGAATWLAVVFAVFMLFRIVSPLLPAASDGRSRTLAQRIGATVTTRVWSPHAATAVIGITFVVILLLIGGTWAYTDVLADLARGMAASLLARVVLVAALFLGALAGGYTAGRFRSTRIGAAQLAQGFFQREPALQQT